MSSADPEDLDDSLRGWRIKALHTPEESRPVPVTEAGLTIGRAQSNDLILDSEEFPGVSGTHVRVALRGDDVVVEDLDSKNGTLIAGERIHRETTTHGTVFELGSGGPRFVVLSPTQSDQTVMLTEAPKKRSLGTDTVAMVREQLGIPEHTDVRDVVRKNRRNTYLLLVVIAFLVAGGFYIYYEQQQGRTEIQKIHARIDAQVRDSKDEIDAARSQWNARVGQFDAARKNWEDQRKNLLEQKKRLESDLQGRASATDVAQLRKLLRETEDRIEKYNPVKLENSRYQNVLRVVNSVALLEVTQTFVDKSGRALHFETQPSGDVEPNLQGRGRRYEQDSTGSGFCFHKDGYLLTNAHVVLKKDSRDEITLADGMKLESHVEVHVVFSGTKTRHPAEVRKWEGKGKKDLALVKIKPFPGMPFVPGIDTSSAKLPVAMDVFLTGFPLGKRALQQGETVIASTFRGIVSRTVDEYLQVDADVHPGNSGGPVIDGSGKVIGVVVGMQRIDEDKSAHAIGYVIPIAYAKEVLTKALLR